MRPRGGDGGTFAALALLAAAACAPALSGGLALDDPHVLADALRTAEDPIGRLSSPVGRFLAAASLLWDRLWFPEAFTPRTLAAMGARGGAADLAGLRMTSLLVHVASGFCVWILARRRLSADGTAARRGAAVAAAFFLLHPLALATVPYVAQRGAVLSVAGILLAAAGALAFREGRRWGAAAAVAGAAAAALSHPQGVLAPAFLFVVAMAFPPRPAGGGASGRSERILAAAAAVGLAWGAFRFVREVRYLDGAEGPGASREALARQGDAVGREVLAALLPRRTPLEAPGSDGRLGWAALAALAGGAVLAFRRGRPAAAAALGWIVVAVLPVAAFPLKDPFFPHRLYSALPGLAWIVGWLAARFPPRGRVLPAAALAALFVSGGAQARLWRTPLALWADACRAAPGAARAQVNAGNGWALAGRPIQAAAHYRRTLRIDPAHAGAAENLRRVGPPGR